MRDLVYFTVCCKHLHKIHEAQVWRCTDLNAPDEQCMCCVREAVLASLLQKLRSFVYVSRSLFSLQRH